MARWPAADDRTVEDVHITKLLRVDAAICRLRETAAAADPLDADALERLDAAVRQLLVETGSAVPEPLLEELAELVRPFQHPDRTADEVRMSLAQLAGWVSGLERAVSAG